MTREPLVRSPEIQRRVPVVDGLSGSAWRPNVSCHCEGEARRIAEGSVMGKQADQRLIGKHVVDTHKP